MTICFSCSPEHRGQLVHNRLEGIPSRVEGSERRFLGLSASIVSRRLLASSSHTAESPREEASMKRLDG